MHGRPKIVEFSSRWEARQRAHYDRRMLSTGTVGCTRLINDPYDSAISLSCHGGKRSRMAKPIPSHGRPVAFMWAARALQKTFVFATRDRIELRQTVAIAVGLRRCHDLRAPNQQQPSGSSFGLCVWWLCNPRLPAGLV
jgi:hypothetical protein